MVQLKLGSNAVAPEPTGFGVYEGPEPRNGTYNAVIKQMRMKLSQAKNLYFNMLLEFEDNEGEKEVYNSYPLWHMLTPGDSELQQVRLSQLLTCVTGKREATVDYNPLDADQDPGKVKKIGGKDPIGTKVKIVVQRERDNRSSDADAFQIRVTDMFPRKGGPATKVEELEVEEEEAIEPVDAEGGVDPDGVDLDELREELEALTLPKLKAYAKENTELTPDDLKGLKAPQVVELILAQYSDEEAEDEDEEPEDGSEEDDGLDDLDLAQLKKEAKAAGATLKDLKGLDEEGVRAWIREARTGTDEGEEPTQDAEGRWLYSYAMTLDRDALVAMLVEAGYDAEDFEDEEEYDIASLVDTLVEEDAVAAQDAAPF